MAKVNVNPETGEIEQGFAVVEIENTLPITVSETEVVEHYFNPQKIIDLISEKAGSPVFDTSTKKGRDECKSHAFKIIRCITPIAEISKSKAADAKKIVNQDTSFRRITEEGIRKLAAIHRQPLTEWEEEQAAIKAEAERIEAERLAELKYLQDWDDALAFNELFDLRKEREAIEREKARIAAEKAEAERVEAEVQRRLETERLRLEIEKSEREQKEIAERERARQQAEFIENKEKLESQQSKNCEDLHTELNLTPELVAVTAESVDNQADYEEYATLSTEKVIIEGQPSNDEIINAIAFYFEVSHETALSWLKNMGEF